MLKIYLAQVRNDYLKKNFESLDLDTAIQLCCIEIRRCGQTTRYLDKQQNIWTNNNIFGQTTRYLDKPKNPLLLSAPSYISLVQPSGSSGTCRR